MKESPTAQTVIMDYSLRPCKIFAFFQKAKQSDRIPPTALQLRLQF